ncbi:class D sortase [Aciditerrimonas ferrireducens]|jgi:LPXTG-site transpeptidase (sortase) family protein|uniref:class D sortase n=1 Tax=Aciditerrimonas ferrireducens TaxID=667306 RepID=UPI002002D2BF|nr:class D sortase [Aciditerrimonas ferrireducens]MCK4177917.1 class D sortase [Aciditerrimonas ferrireducens]
MTRRARVVLGLVLVWGALGVLGYRLGWELHLRRGQATLLQQARTVDRASEEPGGSCSGTQVTPVLDGQLAGVLDIPSLGVQAPVESGTSDAVLAVAVGHFDGSPWPGQPGTAALLAHDVSYFARIDQLQPGDTLQYQSGCVTVTFRVVGHQIVHDGAPLPAVPGSGLDLDTCWPTDALWFTPDRYVVEAQEVGISVGKPAPVVGPTATVAYRSSASPALAATGLALTQNEEPMGTLRITGSPSQAWSQSPGPLAVQVAALADYFGGYHAAERDDQAWWASVAPGLAMPPALVGAQPLLSDASPLNVTIQASGDEPQTVTLQTTLPLAGGSAPGRYAMTVTEAVHGTTLVITSWEANRVG